MSSQYRIVQRGGKYIAQRKGWFLWHDMFCAVSVWASPPKEFNTDKEAKDAILEYHAEPKDVYVVEEFEIPDYPAI